MIEIPEESLGTAMTVVKKISAQRIHNMRRQGRFVWESYLRSMHAITLTTLQIINDRVFPYAAKRYEDWNEIPNKVREGGIAIIVVKLNIHY